MQMDTKNHKESGGSLNLRTIQITWTQRIFPPADTFKRSLRKKYPPYNFFYKHGISYMPYQHNINLLYGVG